MKAKAKIVKSLIFNIDTETIKLIYRNVQLDLCHSILIEIYKFFLSYGLTRIMLCMTNYYK